MDINNLTLGQIKEIGAMVNGVKPAVDCPCEEAKTQIVVFQRGWIMVGKVRTMGAKLHVTNASVIRIWGTTAGLGELAANGPTPTTKLDKCPDTSTLEICAVLRMDCNAEKWAMHV